MFDLKTLQTMKDIPLPAQGPDGYLFDGVSKRIFTLTVAASMPPLLTRQSGEVAGSVPLGGKLEAAQADGAGHIFVNIEDKNHDS